MGVPKGHLGSRLSSVSTFLMCNRVPEPNLWFSLADLPCMGFLGFSAKNPGGDSLYFVLFNFF